MDKIWYRHRSKSVIGRCGGDERTNDHTDKSRTLKNKKLTQFQVIKSGVNKISRL